MSISSFAFVMVYRAVEHMAILDDGLDFELLLVFLSQDCGDISK